jgi:hypothetical protein
VAPFGWSLLTRIKVDAHSAGARPWIETAPFRGNSDSVHGVSGAVVGSVPDPVLCQYSVDGSSGFSVVMAEDPSQPFLSSDRS